MACTTKITYNVNAVLESVPAAVRSNPFLCSDDSTTYKIQSALPLTQDSISRLSIKSGWLEKENERNVWKKHWCCVVPHTYLYYFDEEFPGESHESLLQYFKSGKPPGIIDLEAYSTSCKHNDDIFAFELKGDDNSDIRSLHFKAETEDDLEEWVTTLLQKRYDSVVDEMEACQEICKSASDQVMEWSEIVENMQSRNQTLDMVTKNVRKAAEKNRIEINSIVRRVFEQNLDTTKEDTRGNDNSDDIKEEQKERSPERSKDTGDNEVRGSFLSEISSKYLSMLEKIEENKSNDTISSYNVDSVKLLAEFSEMIVKENKELKRELRGKKQEEVRAHLKSQYTYSKSCPRTKAKQSKIAENDQYKLPTTERESNNSKHMNSKKIELTMESCALHKKEKNRVLKKQEEEEEQRVELQVSLLESLRKYQDEKKKVCSMILLANVIAQRASYLMCFR